MVYLQQLLQRSTSKTIKKCICLRIFWAHCILVYSLYYIIYTSIECSGFIYISIDANHLITHIGRGGERADIFWQRLFNFFTMTARIYINTYFNVQSPFGNDTRGGCVPLCIVFTYLYKRHSLFECDRRRAVLYT